MSLVACAWTLDACSLRLNACRRRLSVDACAGRLRLSPRAYPVVLALEFVIVLAVVLVLARVALRAWFGLRVGGFARRIGSCLEWHRKLWLKP